MNPFLELHTEKPVFNQYWYSTRTISAIADEVAEVATKAAFVSTPSIYFSLKPHTAIQENSWLLDLDSQWAEEPRYFAYDFNSPSVIPDECRGSFDCVVLDPPFITEDVWQKYATTARILLKDEGKIILTTIAENRDLLADLLDVHPQMFKPSIPNLIYQYDLFTNYHSSRFSQPNPEIPD
uniref:N6-adenine methyltransferase n=1 Tax=Tetraselmis sp. GSL018 TaxID=582737 RepID=A0A061R709_9CHLO|mmetsp:Transcript_42694/g.101351  ORF Transcript_42694/g.101351 Transcript_42694/m.101351 type:complete len:181 (+) Transcript_42694:87-629(+)